MASKSKTLEIGESINPNVCEKYNLGYCYSTPDGTYLGKYLRTYSEPRPRRTVVYVHKFENGVVDGDKAIPSEPGTNLIVRVECKDVAPVYKPLENSLDPKIPLPEASQATEAIPLWDAHPVPRRRFRTNELEVPPSPLAEAVPFPISEGIRFGGKSRKPKSRKTRKSRKLRKSRRLK
jgi:hypothetical protein